MKGMRDCIALPPIVLTGSAPAFQVLDGAPGDGATNTLGKEAYRRGDRLFPSHGDRNISCAWQAANLLWRFEPWSRETGMDRAADNHYPTSSTDIIARVPADIRFSQDYSDFKIVAAVTTGSVGKSPQGSHMI